MSDAIDREIFEHLVALAALELDPSEAEYLRRELNNQLRSIRELEDIPLDPQTPLTFHGVPYTPATSPPIRADEWIACPNPDDILDQAPEVEERYIVVPDIPHEEI
jgi:aspartyl-tRNA(Asn)/glutamyl-tRNA(Gln) amidotransferase subunit C